MQCCHWIKEYQWQLFNNAAFDKHTFEYDTKAQSTRHPVPLFTTEIEEARLFHVHCLHIICADLQQLRKRS